MLTLTAFLTACQNPTSEKSQEHEHPSTTQEAPPNLNDLCQNLKTEMQNMSNHRTTLALEQLNQRIRTCLPIIEVPEQQQLLLLSKQMYKQFLNVKRTPEQQHAFETYTQDKAQYPTLQQLNFEKLNIRDQYLLRHLGQAYIELTDTDSSPIHYQRNPQYLAKVFAPYLPDVESIFISELAEQQAQPSMQGHDLIISPQEIAKRALFWQKYQLEFPQSMYRTDAKNLAQYYTALLFKGSPKTPVSYDYNGAKDIDPASLTEIQQLAKLEPTELSNQARKFLVFIDLSSTQRQQLLPKQHRLDTSSATSSGVLTQQQLDLYLGLKPTDSTLSNKKDAWHDMAYH